MNEILVFHWEELPASFDEFPVAYNVVDIIFLRKGDYAREDMAELDFDFIVFLVF